MRVLALGVLALGVLALPGAAAAKRCDDAAVAAARAAVAAQCDCTTARNHGDYVKCVGDAVKGLPPGTLPQECKGAVMECAARSTCGKPGFVTCCRVDRRGKVRCSIKSGENKCRPPNGGTACVGAAASCCDSCQPSSAGGAFVCQGGTTTSTTAAPTTTSAAPTTTSAAPTTTTAAPTTSTSSAPPTTSTAAPTTSTSSTMVVATTTSSTSTTAPGSPSGAFFDGTS